MRKVLVVLALLLCLPAISDSQSINYYPSGVATINPADLWLWEDFCGGSTTSVQIGTHGWLIVGLANSTLQVSATDFCLANFRNSGASAVGALYLLGTGQGAPVLYSSFRDSTFRAAFTTGANVPTYRVGFFSTALNAAPSDDGVYFECLTSDTNWFAVTRDGGTTNETRTDTGVAFAAGTRAVFRIEQPSAGVFVFSIDGVVRATHSGAQNIPAQASPAIPVFQLTTTGTANLDILADYFGLRAVIAR